jgi:hypothetical protein
MNIIARRVIVVATVAGVVDSSKPIPALTPATKAPSAKIEGVVVVQAGIKPSPVVLAGIAVGNFYDSIISPDGVVPANTTIVYDANLTDDGKISVVVDEFSKGEFLHTWAGWPVPGS